MKVNRFHMVRMFVLQTCLGFGLFSGSSLFIAGTGDASNLRRIAIVVGNNIGNANDVQLRYAHKDASTVAKVMTELGQVDRKDLFLLLEQTPKQLLVAVKEANRRIESDGRPAMLFIYYSGHADKAALHMSGQELPWADLQGILSQSKADLRVAMIDACQAGSLTAPKGFSLASPVEVKPRLTRGTAMLVSADSTEAAQESASLGGSIFTHFLVSGLRGAADENGDRRVSLSETRTYTTRETQRATSAWARSVQHPTYHFDVSGYGDFVLTDLQNASTSLRLSQPLAGRLFINERGTPQVVVEAEKRAGEELEFGLPSGRYLVHLRRPNAIYVADVTLPWGGSINLEESDFVPHSYQSVAQKGGLVEIHRHRLLAAAKLHTPLLRGMGITEGLSVGYDYKMKLLEIGLQAWMTQARFNSIDTFIDNQIVAGRLSLSYERPTGIFDIYGSIFGEGQQWKQQINNADPRTSFVLGTGLQLGFRLPIVSQLFIDLSFGGLVLFPRTDDGNDARLVGSSSLGMGVLL
jgi:uncharacterized caspase-like protein